MKPESSFPVDPGSENSLVEAPSLEGRTTGELGAFWATGISLLLVLAALLALALVPSYLDRRVAPIQNHLQETLRPAERLAAEIELAQTQQIAALETWVFSGEGRFRQRYRDAVRAEEDALRSLQPLTEGMDLSVREALAGVTQVSFSQLEFQLEIRAVLNEEVSRETFQEEWTRERGRFDETLSATLALRRVLVTEAESGRDRKSKRPP